MRKKKKKKPKNILLITPFAPPQLGGAETHLEDLYEYLRHQDYKVTLLTYQPLTKNLKGKSQETKKNLTIYRYQWFGNNLFAKFESYPPIFNFLYITPYLFLRCFLYMLRHRNEVDLIHVFGLNASFIARVFKQIFNKKIIMSTEALYDFKPYTLFGRVCKWVLSDFDAILAGSDESRDDVLKLGIPKEKIIVYVHWIRLDKFRPGDKKKLKQQLGWEDRFTVLYVGRLIKIKGVNVFIDVAKKSNKSINFKIIGDEGPELAAVERADKNIENLDYVGPVPNTKIGTYFAAADVYVYPALYKEDLARVLIESMACGTPVINTNEGSGIYRLTPEVGFVLQADPDKIRQKIEYLHRNPALLKKMSRASIAFAGQFGPKLGKIITDTYEKVISSDI